MAVNYSGTDYVIYVASAAPSAAAEANDAAYAKLGLNVNLFINGSANDIEKSNKDDGTNTSWLAGRKVETISGSFIFDHTEDSGQAKLQTVWESASRAIWFLVTTVTSGDEEFYGTGVLTGRSLSFNDQEPSTGEFEIRVSGGITQAAGTAT